MRPKRRRVLRFVRRAAQNKYNNNNTVQERCRTSLRGVDRVVSGLGNKVRMFAVRLATALWSQWPATQPVCHSRDKRRRRRRCRLI